MVDLEIIIPCKTFREVEASLSINSHWPGKILFVVYEEYSSEECNLLWSRFSKMSFEVYHLNQPGIYEAMNFGILISSARFLAFFGSTDVVQFQNIDKLVREFEADLFVLPFSMKNKLHISSDSPVSFVKGNVWCHQAVIYKKSLLEDLECFDTSFRIASDFHSYLESIRIGAEIHVIKDLSFGFGILSPGGISGSGQFRGYSEEMRIIYNSNHKMKFVFYIFCMLRFIRKKIMSLK